MDVLLVTLYYTGGFARPIILQENSSVNLIIRLLPLLFLLIAVLACGRFQSSEEGSPGATTSSTAASDDLTGSYTVSGTNEGGAGAYTGSLNVTKRGDVYQFSWDTAGKKFDGVGVRTADTVAVAFAEGERGDGCGVVLYRIGDNGTLDGTAGYWGTNSSEKETAVRTKGTALEGMYDVKGTNTAGQDYEGTLAVNKSGAGYTFSWSAGSTFEGFGIRQGDKVAVGFGGNKCGFVSYEIRRGGTLDGKWGGYGSRSVGIEVAKKK